LNKIDFAELSYWLDAVSDYQQMRVGAAEGANRES
jgi:hypothetical protein